MNPIDYLVALGQDWDLSVPDSSSATFETFAERNVYRALIRQPGIASIEVYPQVPGTQLLSDFRVTASNGISVYVEVSKVGADPATDRDDLYRMYRAQLAEKVMIYEALDLGPPVIIWADEIVPALIPERMQDLTNRLELSS